WCTEITHVTSSARATPPPRWSSAAAAPGRRRVEGWRRPAR
ncbi:MAG: hypothetical protein AVDCRST_MAG40-2367, partial [uncultured Gemmatimonadaceae bacterium]